MIQSDLQIRTVSSASSTTSSSSLSASAFMIKNEPSIIQQQQQQQQQQMQLTQSQSKFIDFNNNPPHHVSFNQQQQQQQQHNSLYEQYCRAYEAQYNNHHHHHHLNYQQQRTSELAANADLIRRYYYPTTTSTVTFNNLSSSLNQIEINLNNMNMSYGCGVGEEYDDDEGGDDDEDDDECDGDSCDETSHKSSQKQKLTSQQQLQRKRHTKGELKCEVCGANANGYNFDAITCESCKAFFRRNAYKGVESFRCLNNSNCTVTQSTRKKCKRCRIAKCFAKGMKKEWIMTENEREEKRRKIEENRRKKLFKNQPVTQQQQQQQQQTSTQQEQQSLLNSSINSNSNSTTNKIRRRRRRRRGANSATAAAIATTITPLTTISDQQQQQNASSSSNYLNNYPIDLSLNNNTSNHYSQPGTFFEYPKLYDGSFMSYDIKPPQTLIQQQPYQPLTTTSLYHNNNNNNNSDYTSDENDDYNSDDLSSKCDESSNEHDIDLYESNELIKSIDSSYNYVIEQVRLSTNTDTKSIKEINSVINITEIAVRRLIAFIKLNNDFKLISDELKIKVLKSNMMEFLLLQGVMSYDKKEDVFHEPHSKLDHNKFHVQSLKQTYGEYMFKRIMNITHDLYSICKQHFIIIKLLIFVILFSTDRCKDLLNADIQLLYSLQNKYLQLLHQYMRNLYKWPECDFKFAKMIHLLDSINTLGNEFRQIVINRSDPNQLHRLMQEIFTIPNTNNNIKQEPTTSIGDMCD